MKLRITVLVLLAIIGAMLTVILFQHQALNDRDERIGESAELMLRNNEGMTRSYNYMQERYADTRQEVVDLLALVHNEGWERGYVITAYTANDPSQGTNNIVATGFNLDLERVDNLPIAASNYFPVYSIVEIYVPGEGIDTRIILDTGLGYRDGSGWCDHKWVDLLFDCKSEAFQFGINHNAWVRVLRWGDENGL